MSGVSLTAAQFSTRQREELARRGVAMKGGGFPIRNRTDLKNAIMEFGRAGDKAAAKRHIIKRARELDLVEMLPESWGVTAAVVAAGKSARQEKIAKVMREFKAGRLKSSTGEVVTNRKQALAIAMSEARSLAAAGPWDESKHPREPGGRREGGRFARAKAQIEEMSGRTPSDAEVQQALAEEDRLNESQSMYSGDRMPPKAEGESPVKISTDGNVMRWDPDADSWEQVTTADELGQQAQSTAEDLIKATDEVGIAEFESGKSEDQAYADAITTLEENGDWSSMIEEGMAQTGLPMEDDADWEASYNLYEAEVVKRMRQAAPVFDKFFGGGGQTASALTAAAAGLAPLTPPKTWFDKPNLEGPTPITITADGRIFGHAALWGTCHTGISGQCRTPPRSQTDYRYFHLGELETDAGPVPVGRVTMDTGHAPLTASRGATVRHYDDTGTGAAHVRAGEDEHGIWVAGAISPELPAEKVRTLRAAALSGDWRSINGQLELVGMLAVNVPGFPVPRAMAASLIVEDEPHTMAMVAAGVYCDPADVDRKVRALTARARGVDGLLEMAMGGTPQGRRLGAMSAAAWDESKHPRGGKGTHEGGKFVKKGEGGTPAAEKSGPSGKGGKTEAAAKKPGEMKPDEYAAYMDKIQEEYAAQRREAIKSEPDSIGLARDLGGQEVAPGMEIVDQSYDVTPPGGKVARKYGYFSLRDKATGAEMTALPSNYTVTKTELDHIKAAFDAAEAVDLSKPKTELAGILNKTNMRQNGVFRVRLIDRLAAANRNPFRKGTRDWEMVQHYVDNPNPRSGFAS